MTGYEASGLHNPDNKEERYFRMGNLKIDYRGEVTIDDNGNPALRLDYPISNLLPDDERLYGESVRQKILDVCNLKKGVSDVAFYYGTMMITQELFSLYRRYPFFVLLMLGRHGSFKSMLSRRTITLLEDDRGQEIKFYNLKKNTELEELLSNTEIFPILIDDIIPVNGYGQKKRYADIFDWVSRSGDRERFKGGVIVTAERIPEEVVSSAYDRIWEISMPTFKDEDKKQWYSILSDVTNQDLAYFYVDYCRKLMMNYDRVLKDINIFWESFELPVGIKRETRIADHFEFLVLSEYLLKKYYLGLPEVTVGTVCNTNTYLIKRAESQQNRIMKMDMRNREIDLPYHAYQVLLGSGHSIKIIPNRTEYEADKANECKALLDGDYIFVKPDVLREAINHHADSVITVKKLSSGLEKERILVSGEGNSKTVTGLKSGRHYKLDYKKLISYKDEYEIEYEENLDYIIPVIRG